MAYVPGTQASTLRVVFAGGGTGGHLYPALAIADEVKKLEPDAVITFIGTREKIEARVVPQRGYAFAPIWISGFRRSLSIRNLLFPLKLATALVQSFILMKKYTPDVVVGTGGYVCGPPLYAATVLGIPTLIQEQNSYPGATTRRLAARVNEMHLTFESSKRYLSRLDNVKVSGNPTSGRLGSVSREEAARRFELQPDVKTLLVFGGSLGATSINKAVGRHLGEILDLGVQIIWQTGRPDYGETVENVRSTLTTDHQQKVRVQQYIEEMEYAYAAADLAVCRAGASTLAELTVVGLPSVLVPYPHAAADHQTENAKAMVESGAAVMVKDADLGAQLVSIIRLLIADDKRLKSMREKSRSLGRPEAASILAQAVLALADN